ncbi:MAG: benzoate-CoA ligase family protein [Dermatophilaceae bacterium]
MTSVPTTTPDLISALPRDYNAAADLISRNLDAGRAAKVAFIDDTGWHTYGEVAERAARWANATRRLGIEMEQRVMLCLLDTVDFPTVFLGSMLAGVVPVPVSALLTPENYAYLVADSRVRAVVVSDQLLPAFQPLLGKLPFLRHLIVSGSAPPGMLALDEVLAAEEPDVEPAPTTKDDVGMWLYSSGSTGAPKGTMHVHSSLIATALGAGQHVVQIAEDDVSFSVSKLSFAYGLGCGMTFPMSVGATSVLLSTPPNPASIFPVLREHKPTVFAGVPTAYASMLAHPDLPDPSEMGFRVCLASGEGLPPSVGQRWQDHFGIEILDGIGCTEMLNHFISNRPGMNRYGTSGTPIPGYVARLVDDDGAAVRQGDIGHLQISGPSRADGYYNNREKSAKTFQGTWTITGDKFHQDDDGFYHYEGRSDDMLNVGGLPVSPFDVESALITHDAVLEAAVVGKPDPEGLVKPIAYVVVKDGIVPSDELATELKDHVRSRLAKYKFPRWVEFVDELPKTPTGKIQRFKLRLRANGTA